MMLRHSFLVLVLTITTSPTDAAPIPLATHRPPTFYGQTASLETVFKRLKQILPLLEIDSTANNPLESLNLILDQLPLALDKKKNIGFYGYLNDRLFIDPDLVVVIPIQPVKSLDKLALGFAQNDTWKIQPLLSTPGRFTFSHRATDTQEAHKKYFQITNDAVYLVLNGSQSLLNDPARVPATVILDPQKQQLFHLTLKPSRVPQVYRDFLKDLLTLKESELIESIANAPNLPVVMCYSHVLRDCLRRFDRHWDLLFTQAKSIEYLFDFDDESADFTIETVVTPKPETTLAKEVAELPQAKGRFGQLQRPDSVTGLSLCIVPSGVAPEIFHQSADLIQELSQFMIEQLGVTQHQPTYLCVTELLSALTEKARLGQVDLGVSLYAPAQGRYYTAVAAIGLKSTKALAPEFQKLMASLLHDPDKKQAKEQVVQKNTKGFSSIELPMLPSEYHRVFGKKSKLYWHFTEDALYLAIGPRAEQEVEYCLQLKPVETPTFQVRYHPLKYALLDSQLSRADDFERLAAKIELFHPYPKLGSLFSINVRGGSQYRVTLRTHSTVASQVLMVGMQLFTW